jgi:hypothetical protein
MYLYITAWYAVYPLYTAFFVDDAKLALHRSLFLTEQKEAADLLRNPWNTEMFRFSRRRFGLYRPFSHYFFSGCCSCPCRGWSRINSFDPFGILEVISGARSLKGLPLAFGSKYHPTKNPGNRAAEAKFMMVSQSLRSLDGQSQGKLGKGAVIDGKGRVWGQYPV